MKLSVDVGNGYVKAVNERGETLHFPTVIRINTSHAQFGNGGMKYRIRINDVDYYIGTLAISQKGVRHWGNNDSLLDDTGNYAALCSHILCKPDENGETNIDLLLGLPYDQYMKQRDTQDKLNNLQGKQFKTVMNDEIKTAVIKTVSLCPQGIGAYFFNISDIHGNPRKDAEKRMNALVIDVGYGTTDIVAFDGQDGAFDHIEDDSFCMNNEGVYNIDMRVREAVKDKGLDVDVTVIETALQANDSKVDSIKGQFDLKPYEDKEYESLSREILKQLSVKLKGGHELYRNIYLTGGGAKKLFPFIQKQIPGIQLQEDYIYCNCKGYLALANS